jgi:hypothetical protein
MTDRKIKLKLEFNTAITDLDPNTGKWDEQAHNYAVRPLRGLIMQIDGVSGCFIARYGMEIDYMSDVTSKAQITKAAKAAVRDVAARDGFFPLRGKKVPSARTPKPVQSTSATWWVAQVSFGTDLFVDKDEESTTKIVHELTSWLANADGARQSGVGQRMLYVKFDQRQVSPEKMEAHLKLVVAQIMNKRTEKGYFPFGEPVFSYEARVTPYLI